MKIWVFRVWRDVFKKDAPVYMVTNPSEDNVIIHGPLGFKYTTKWSYIDKLKENGNIEFRDTFRTLMPIHENFYIPEIWE